MKSLLKPRWIENTPGPMQTVLVLLGVGVFSGLTPHCRANRPQVAAPADLPPQFSHTGQNPLPDRWWHSLDDEVLNRLVERALAANLSVKIGWDRLDQAAAHLKRSGADQWPTLEANAGAGYIFSDRGNDPSFTLGLAAQYELDIWGRVRATNDASKLDLLATQEDLQAITIALTAEIATTYYKLIERQVQLQLIAEQTATNQQILSLVAIRFRTGSAKAADLLQQRQLIETAEADRAAIHSQIATLKNHLAILLGEPPGREFGTENGRLVQLPPPPQSGVPAVLIQRRPDVRAAHHRLRAADRRAAAAVAERFPRLSLGAAGSTTAADARDLFSNWLVNLAANLTAPLIDGHRRKADAELAEAKFSESIHAYGRAALTAIKEVEDALNREYYQGLKLESLQRQLAISSQVIERIRDNYTKGAEDYIRVLDVLLKHQALQKSIVAAQLALLEQRIALCRALAGGIELSRAQPGTIDRVEESQP